MTLQEIKDALDAGKTVHWATKGYTVLKDVLRNGEVQYLIAYNHKQHNASYIGLTWRDGVTLNGKPEEFFVG